MFLKKLWDVVGWTLIALRHHTSQAGWLLPPPPPIVKTEDSCHVQLGGGFDKLKFSSCLETEILNQDQKNNFEKQTVLGKRKKATCSSNPVQMSQQTDFFQARKSEILSPGTRERGGGEPAGFLAYPV